MSFHHHVLPNGLHIIGETSPSARSVALGFFVRTGARDEGPNVSGVTHFLEHMVFKGTPKRTAFDVNRDFDRIGSNPNAFTSEENTVFYAAFLPEYLPQAVDILADILRPSLRTDDFDMEKNVIIEEIGMYEDQPLWSAYDAAASGRWVGCRRSARRGPTCTTTAPWTVSGVRASLAVLAEAGRAGPRGPRAP